MKLIILSIISIVFLIGCKKYLETKPDKSLVIPSTLTDLQSLLDNNSRMNQTCPSLGEVSADNYFLKQTTYQSLQPWQRNAYIWDTVIYSTLPNDWSITFNTVYYANVVLDALKNIEKTSLNQGQWNNIKGEALFFRSRSFLQAAWTWCKSYDNSTALTDLGLPLRLSSLFGETSVRANLEDTYKTIVNDLKESILLLSNTSTHVMRPSKAAAYALLARAYLSMRDYPSCLKYSDSALQRYNVLINYSTLNPNLNYPIRIFNSEVIHHSNIPVSYFNLANVFSRVDSTLYSMYDIDDLRKIIFFKPDGTGYYKFHGSYYGGLNQFTGIATDELFLMRAECYARAGITALAMKDLNDLLVTRWKVDPITGLTTYIDKLASDANDALAQILVERRKELLMRDLRWMDIKRLNKEGANIIIKRIVNSQIYELPVNSEKYALPLPTEVIQISGMKQNPRN